MSLPFQERGEDAPFPLPLFVRKGVTKKKKTGGEEGGKRRGRFDRRTSQEETEERRVIWPEKKHQNRYFLLLLLLLVLLRLLPEGSRNRAEGIFYIFHLFVGFFLEKIRTLCETTKKRGDLRMKRGCSREEVWI